MASSKLRADLERVIGDACRGLSAAASQVTAALHAVGAERRRTLFERTALAFCASVLGGVVAGLLVHLL